MILRRSRLIIAVCMSLLFVVTTSTLALGTSKVPATPEISLEKAISLALSNDEAYKSAQLNVIKTSEQSDYAAYTLSGYTYTAPLGVGTTSEAQVYSALSSELTYQMSKKTLQSNEDRVSNSISSKYGAVLVARAKLTKAKSDATVAERDYRIAQVKYRVGMISSLAYEAAQKTYDSSTNTLDTAKQVADGAYAAFNPLVGLWAEDRPVLTDGTTFENLYVADLESEVNRVVETAPNIWLAEQTATLKDYQMNVLVYTGSYEPYLARQAEVDQAKLDATAAKKQYANSTRNVYYSIRQIENQYASLQDAAVQADIAVRTQQAMFDAGMSTRLDLDKATNTLDSYNAQLVELKWSHNNLVNTFKKPWAASSSS